jgi:ubiquinone/menaquinone biosynthesis C-methylase UbiE
MPLSNDSESQQQKGHSASQSYRGETARAYDRRRFTSSAGKAIQDVEMELFQSELRAVATGSQVLEVGCGTGRFLLTAAESGMRCHGVDLSPDMLAEAKAKLGSRGLMAELHECSGQALPLRDRQFDFVYSIRATNQMISRQNALDAIYEMTRVCRPGGRLLVEFVNACRRPLGRGRRDVYLWPSDVAEAAEQGGARMLRLRGAFFFGMTAIHRVPTIFRPVLITLDGLLSRLVPALCARCYATFEKTDRKIA